MPDREVKCPSRVVPLPHWGGAGARPGWSGPTRVGQECPARAFPRCRALLFERKRTNVRTFDRCAAVRRALLSGVRRHQRTASGSASRCARPSLPNPAAARAPRAHINPSLAQDDGQPGVCGGDSDDEDDNDDAAAERDSDSKTPVALLQTGLRHILVQWHLPPAT